MQSCISEHSNTCEHNFPGAICRVASQKPGRGGGEGVAVHLRPNTKSGGGGGVGGVGLLSGRGGGTLYERGGLNN